MKMDIVAGSGNDEFYTPAYAVAPLLKYVDPSKTVWCPFDTEQSLIVKALRGHGNTVIPTHISTGDDFFSTDIREADLLISNPPYSLKNDVFARAFALEIPFALLVGVVGLFESKTRFDLFSQNDFEIMWMNKRVAYFKSFEEQKPSLNPPFSSVWLTRGLLPKANTFEQISKSA